MDEFIAGRRDRDRDCDRHRDCNRGIDDSILIIFLLLFCCNGFGGRDCGCRR